MTKGCNEMPSGSADQVNNQAGDTVVVTLGQWAVGAVVSAKLGPGSERRGKSFCSYS